jgi:hypothetical protein
MLVPTLIELLSRRGQAFITVSKLHAAVQSRYWKWLITNVILVYVPLLPLLLLLTRLLRFCVGLSAFTAFLNAFRNPASVLPIIAKAFPQGATFFVSWTLLVIGIHHGVQVSLFGYPYFMHASYVPFPIPSYLH